jgi:hypothetical protein
VSDEYYQPEALRKIAKAIASLKPNHEAILWREVFVGALGRGVGRTDAKDLADDSVRSFREADMSLGLK